MNRLTTEKGFYMLNDIDAMIEKLSAYEDTGLEPEEIVKLHDENISIKKWNACEEKLFEKYQDDSNRLIEVDAELTEYKALEEQGLLIKLPCKVGDTAYWISPFRSGINQGKIEFININKFGIDLAIMGQEGVLNRRELAKVFLTREEAEKALEDK